MYFKQQYPTFIREHLHVPWSFAINVSVNQLFIFVFYVDSLQQRPPPYFILFVCLPQNETSNTMLHFFYYCLCLFLSDVEVLAGTLLTEWEKNRSAPLKIQLPVMRYILFGPLSGNCATLNLKHFIRLNPLVCPLVTLKRQSSCSGSNSTDILPKRCCLPQVD